MREFLIVCLLASLFPCAAYTAGKGRHIVVVVWDGMRPDFVTPEYAPALYKLAQVGVFFRNHHPVYLSATEVNGAALATGAYPRRSGLIANREFRPGIEALKPIGTEALDAVRKGDQLTGGNYLRVPTLAEILRRNGQSTVIAGTKAVALLYDRTERPAASPNVTLFEGRTLPVPILTSLTNALGPFPETGTSKTNRDLWTTRALIGPLWKDGIPPFSLLWLSEPDFSQHTKSPGTQHSLAAIGSSDHNLGLVVSTLKERGVYEQTDIFVVSDHGFSTVARAVDVATALRTNGFRAMREFSHSPARGDVLVVGNGGSVLLYVIAHEKQTIGRLVSFLQREDYVGAIFTRRPAKGTFKLEKVFLDSPEAPDVVFSLRWTAEKNPSGVPGQVLVDAEAQDLRTNKYAPGGEARDASLLRHCQSPGRKPEVPRAFGSKPRRRRTE